MTDWNLTHSELRKILKELTIEMKDENGTSKDFPVSSNAKKRIDKYLAKRQEKRKKAGSGEKVEDSGGEKEKKDEPTTDETRYQNHTKSIEEKKALWSENAVSYSDIAGWYSVTENETKCVPRKPTGFCPFDGMHFDVDTMSERYGAPDTVQTGSPNLPVCRSHKHIMAKREQTRKLMSWAKDKSGYFERKRKTWRVCEFPEDLQNRVIMFLENRGEHPSQRARVYNKEESAGNVPQGNAGSAGSAQKNPLGLTLGVPGVVKCISCGALARKNAKCPVCGGSPLSNSDKAKDFFGGILSTGANVAEYQMIGRMNNQFAQLDKFCPRCNSKNPGTNISCQNCGAPLSSPQNQQQPQQQNQYNNSPRY